MTLCWSAGSVLAKDDELSELKRAIKELEIAKAAQEQAIRLIIQDSLAKTGSKINDAVTLGGSIDALAVRGVAHDNRAS